jgi:TIR domain
VLAALVSSGPAPNGLAPRSRARSTAREVWLMADSTAPSAGRVFISYRREETAYAAGWLFHRLVDRFGRGQIFKDIDSIQLGDDFVEVITAAVGSCDVLLALIGDRWLTITDERGRARLDDPDDFVRLEIEAALTRNVRVIPILVEGARMPRPDQLPASLAKLVRRHALKLSPGRFEFDIGRLHQVLDSILADVHAQPTVAEPDLPAATGQTSPAPGPLYGQADEQMRLGHFQTAIDLLDELLAADPSHPNAAALRDAASRQLHLADTYQHALDAEAAGEWTAAANGYTEILHLDPTYRDAAAHHQACQTRSRCPTCNSSYAATPPQASGRLFSTLMQRSAVSNHPPPTPTRSPPKHSALWTTRNAPTNSRTGIPAHATPKMRAAGRRRLANMRRSFSSIRTTATPLPDRTAACGSNASARSHPNSTVTSQPSLAYHGSQNGGGS